MQPKKQRNLTGFFNLLSIAGLAGCALLAIWAYKNGILNSVDSLQTFIWKFGYPGCAGYYSNPTGWSQLPGWCDLFWTVARISL